MPAGIVTPLESVKGRRTRQYSPTSYDTGNKKEEKAISIHAEICYRKREEFVQLWSNLSLLQLLRSLGEAVQYIPDGPGGSMTFV